MWVNSSNSVTDNQTNWLRAKTKYIQNVVISGRGILYIIIFWAPDALVVSTLKTILITNFMSLHENCVWRLGKPTPISGGIIFFSIRFISSAWVQTLTKLYFFFHYLYIDLMIWSNWICCRKTKKHFISWTLYSFCLKIWQLCSRKD